MSREIKNDSISTARLTEMVRAIVKQELRRSDGAVVLGDHTTLSNIGTNTHPQIDTHIAATIAELLSLDGRVDTTEAGLISLDGRTDALEGHTAATNNVHGIVWGTYTPTWSNGVNLDVSPTGAISYYIQIGNLVMVFGGVLMDPTMAKLISAECTLPVAPVNNFTATNQARGVINSQGEAGVSVSVVGAKRVLASIDAIGTVSKAYLLIFVYRLDT